MERIEDLFTKEHMDKNTFCYFHPAQRKQRAFIKAVRKFRQTNSLMKDMFGTEEMIQMLGLTVKSKNPKYRKRRVTNTIENAMLWDFLEECEDKGWLLTRKTVEAGNTTKIDTYAKSVKNWVKYIERRAKAGKPVYVRMEVKEEDWSK